jgi:UrcA family protein
MKTIGAALAAASLFATPAAMADAPRNREQVSINVPTEDLDLTTQQGLDRLRVRTDRAIAAACNPGNRLGADLSPDFKCRREMTANVQPTMQQLAARAVETRFSSNSGL